LRVRQLHLQRRYQTYCKMKERVKGLGTTVSLQLRILTFQQLSPNLRTPTSLWREGRRANGFCSRYFLFANVIEKLDDVRLVVVGPDDGYLGELEALTKALRMEDKVLITGPLYGEDKLEAYVNADVYVLPSRYETFPMSLLEAYACGKPVIASKIDGLKDLVKNEDTGLLFESGNVEQLMKSMLLLLNDQNKAEKIGLRGKHLVKENFTIERVVDRLEELCRTTSSL